MAKKKASPLSLCHNLSFFEVSFSVLSHIVLLTEKNSSCFSDKYKQFFCRFNDSPDNKKLKLKILTNIAKRSNASEIMNELGNFFLLTRTYIETNLSQTIK